MPQWLIWMVLLTGAQAVADTVLVGVVYAPDRGATDTRVREDITAIRRAGFNMVVPFDDQARARIAAFARDANLTLGAMKPSGSAYSRIAARPGSRGTAEARLMFWEAMASGARDVAFAAAGHGITPEVLALGETAGIVTRNEALFVPLRTRAEGVRSISTGPMGPVQVRLLESAETMVIIALNRAPAPQRVTIEFARDIPEATWQNLEAGTSIDFVMTREGPVLEHTFAPRDSLVLMVRKRLRK